MADDELTIRVNLQTTEATKASEKLAAGVKSSWETALSGIAGSVQGRLLGMVTRPFSEAAGNLAKLAESALPSAAEETAGFFFGKTGSQFVKGVQNDLGRLSAGAAAEARTAAVAGALGAQGVQLNDDALRAISEITYAQEAGRVAQERRARAIYKESTGGFYGDDSVMDRIAEAAVGGYEQVKRLINSGAASAQSR